MAETIIFILPSIHHVLKAEKILSKSGLEFDLTPVPKEVNPNCGLAIEILPDSMARVIQVLSRSGLRIEAAYRRSDRRLIEVDITSAIFYDSPQDN